MDPTYLLDWAQLLLRWAHVITAIAWIGSSFLFVAIDNSLLPPADDADRAKGVGGERWAVHGGGFYHQQKYPVSPARVPDTLHWSMWESYSTWLTGFGLFVVVYLFNASAFLIDRTRLDLPPAVAIGAALGFLIVFWLAYDGVCRLFGQRRQGDRIVGVLVAALVVLASWLACQLFAGRAAFLLVGAMMATAMSANVLLWIIPGQRQVVAALRAGQPVDPRHGQRGKQRSVHNTYFTLPVVFAMLSNHYPALHAAEHNWLVLVLMMLGAALIRQSFVLRHGAHAHGRAVPWRYAAMGVAVLLGVGIWQAPKRAVADAAPAAVPFARIEQIVAARCVACHQAALAHKGVRLDAPESIVARAQAVYQQAAVLRLMPLNNATGMTDDERLLVKRWYESGAAR